MKTCRRRAGGNFHLRPALDRVGILTVFSGEDAMHQTALLPALERLLAGDAQLRLDLSPGDPRYHEVVLPRLPGRASTLRWATQPTPCPTAKSAPGNRRKKTQQLWRRGVSKTAPRVSKKACLDTPRDRGAHVCCRVSVSASASASVSFLRGFSKVEKVSLPESRQGFLLLVSNDQFSVFS